MRRNWYRRPLTAKDLPEHWDPYFDLWTGITKVNSHEWIHCRPLRRQLRDLGWRMRLVSRWEVRWW